MAGVMVLVATMAVPPSTFCNPVNLAYRFSMNKPSHREAADPTMVMHNNTYWLFASKSGGYWHSKDMNQWEFVTPTGLPLETYAPMVIVINETWYYTAFNARAIYHTDDPYKGEWTKKADMGAYADPGMLVDDDGKVYMYSGCSSNGNIKAVELDPLTWKEVCKTVDAVIPDMKHRGYEVGGDNNEQLLHDPYVEGAFMNKIGSKYYLQYAVPGTQYKSYADGLFVGDSPMGPFSFQPYGPFSHKPTGFAAGAGHSSTFLGAASSPNAAATFWHVATASISVRANFERRVGIYPTSFVDGQFVVDTYLGDYPQPLPATVSPISADYRRRRRSSSSSSSSSTSSSTSSSSQFRDPRLPSWLLLSYNKTVATSSTLDDDHAPALAVNEDIRTWWSAKTGVEGEWLSVDLTPTPRQAMLHRDPKMQRARSSSSASSANTVHAIQVSFADQNCTIIGKRPNASDVYRYYVEYTKTSPGTDADAWLPIPEMDMRNNTLDRPHEYVELSSSIADVGKIRITNLHMPGSAKFSISGLRVFGRGGGDAPEQVAKASVTVTREEKDQRHVSVAWQAAEGADFYIVRYGDANASSLFHNYQVYGATTAEIRALVDGAKYAFAVDAVNENGVTLGDAISV